MHATHVLVVVVVVAVEGEYVPTKGESEEF